MGWDHLASHRAQALPESISTDGFAGDRGCWSLRSSAVGVVCPVALDKELEVVMANTSWNTPWRLEMKQTATSSVSGPHKSPGTQGRNAIAQSQEWWSRPTILELTYHCRKPEVSLV